MASTKSLTTEQENFLEECSLEFSDRFTDSDLEYKQIYDSGIPDPPIMYPWQERGNRFNNRDRGGGGDRFRGEGSYSRDDRRDYGRNNYRDRENHYERRHRPY